METDTSKVLVVLSGGLDSSVLLFDMVKKYGSENVSALTINYGQRHSREIRAARTVAFAACVNHTVFDMPSFAGITPGSSQTDSSVPVPHGHYAAENMKQTVVPNRNMVLLSIAAAHAIAIKAGVIAYAAHAGDHTIYPDCRPEFIEAMQKALDLCDWFLVKLHAPYAQSMTKTDIVKLGAELGVPMYNTYSCYEGGDRHCGKCGTCVERIEAFRDAGVTDTTLYAS